MKNLITAITILILSVPVFAGAPTPGQPGEERQNEYFNLTNRHRVEILNCDHEMANLRNALFDSQQTVKALLEENQYLQENPETVVIDRVVEKPWWGSLPWWAVPVSFVLGGVLL